MPRAWGDTLHSGLDRWDFRLNGWFREEQQFKAPLAKLYTSISKGLNALFRLHFRTAICGARGRGTRRGVCSHQWLLLSTATDLKGLWQLHVSDAQFLSSPIFSLPPGDTLSPWV